MDCVGCDKCRLWGKVQTTGLATALKVLFELDETALEYVCRIVQKCRSSLRPSPTSNINLLQRSEVVALMNTLYRFSESLVSVDDFRKMWHKLDEPTTREIVTEIEEIAAAHVSSKLRAVLVTQTQWCASRAYILRQQAKVIHS